MIDWRCVVFFTWTTMNKQARILWQHLAPIPDQLSGLINL
jgi:hypothetical protein